MGLPIEAVLDDVRQALDARGRAVLSAPPGAGKTTGVPPSLLGAVWLAGRRIVMLEPRRLAARAAAARMAALRREPVGATIGYRVRQDTKVGPATRIEVVTEGVLTRMLQSDPALEGVGLVIFDEFHERSLHADLGLALCLQARAVLRPDLRLLVMSATLETSRIASLLDEAPVIESVGRAYAVETHWLDRPRDGPVEAAVALAVHRALDAHDGDILAFLPGEAEIRRTAERLTAALVPDPDAGVGVIPLYGNLSRAEQDRAIAPSPPGLRKIVLSTAIAETSLTIDGIRTVIDSGLMRVPRFSPRTGLTRLETVTVSRASADQRRGRAGRTGPGFCYRLWTHGEDAGLLERTTPEILEADLAPVALELAAWGVHDPHALRWLDAPPAAAFAQAGELLAELGALGPDGRITEHGRAMVALPVHPRLAHMLLVGVETGRGATAAALAALLEERDVLRRTHGAGPLDPDVRLRLDAMRAAASPRSGHDGGGRRQRADHAGDARLDRPTIARVQREAVRLLRLVGRSTPGGSGRAGAGRAPTGETRSADSPATALAGAIDDADAGLLLAFAYPDRIGRQRGDAHGRFLLRNGRGASVDRAFALAGEPFIAAAVLDGRGRDARVFLAGPLDEGALREHFREQVVTEASVTWDGEAGRVRALRSERLGAIVLAEAHIADADPDAVAKALLDGIRQDGADALPWTAGARAIQQRLRFLHHVDDTWPDVADEALLADLQWLRPYIGGLTSRADLQRLDLAGLLLQRLDHRQRADFDRLAPDRIAVPSGSRIAIDYSDPTTPVLAVRVQEVFGLLETPRIAGGRVPVMMQLLSPARRPVQLTRDLASFWRTTYFDVRKDLRGRYPKHDWPEDPLTATAARGPKRRR